MPRIVYVRTTSSAPGLGLPTKLGLTGRMRSSCTVPSRRTSRASTSIRVSESCEKTMGLPSSPSGHTNAPALHRDTARKRAAHLGQRFSAIRELRLHLQRGGFVDRGDLPEDVIRLVVQLRELEVARLELVGASGNDCRKQQRRGDEQASARTHRRSVGNVASTLTSYSPRSFCVGVRARAQAALVLPFAHDLVAHGAERRVHRGRALRDAHVMRPETRVDRTRPFADWRLHQRRGKGVAEVTRHQIGRSLRSSATAAASACRAPE